MRLSRTFESITLKNLRAHLEMTMTNSTTARNDGRRQRREDGRNKVIDAAIALVLDGHGVPSTEAVVERAGVSSASLFRYFENLDDLRSSFISRYFERIESALAVDQLGTGGLSHRVTTLCTARLEFFASHEPMATLGRTKSQEVPQVRDAIYRLRQGLNEQVLRQFEPEFSTTRQPHRRYCETTICSLTSFDSWSLMRADGMDRDQILRTWRFAITRLLSNS